MDPSRCDLPFSIVFCSALVLHAPCALASDWYVDATASNCATATGGPSDPFCKIADALAVALDGDTVHVAPGTYFENLVVAHDVTLIGTSGAAATIVDGNKQGTVFEISSPNVAIDGITARNGQARFGGGIRVLANDTLLLSRSVVESCSAVWLGSGSKPGDGGGIWVQQGTLVVDDCQIVRNSAQYDGGGILNDAGTVTVSNSTIGGNASGTDAYLYYGYGSGDGGGVHNRSGVVTITNSTIEYNRAGDRHEYYYYFSAGRGGGIYTENGTVTLEDCALSYDFGRGGGGQVKSVDSTLIVRRCDVLGGWTQSSGGGFYLRGGNTTFESCSIDGSSAASWGGGIYVHPGAAVSIDSCRIERCRAERGAGIYNQGDLTLAQSTIGASEAEEFGYHYSTYGYGGGIFTTGNLIVLDSEVSGNETVGNDGAGGAGILVQTGSVTLANTTIAGNQSRDHGSVTNGQGGGIWIKAGATVRIDHCVIAGNSAGTDDVDGTVDSHGYNCIGDTNGATIIGDPTGNLLDVDPEFEDPANGDYSLAPTSPCIDAGDASLVPGGKDVAQNPRLLDGDLDRSLIVDLGAHEFDHVHLAVTGIATPGGTLTLDTSGTAGLPVLLLAGIGESELLVRPLGALFIDLAQAWLIVPWGTIPSSLDVDLDPSFPAPLTIFVQEVAYGVHVGNLSNLVRIEVE
jgi:hypothetical protein